MASLCSKLSVKIIIPQAAISVKKTHRHTHKIKPNYNENYALITFPTARVTALKHHLCRDGEHSLILYHIYIYPYFL